MIRLAAAMLVILPIVVALWGCGGPPRVKPAPPSPTSEAARLTERAAALLGDDPDEAEAILRQAIVLDPYSASAHNNVGVLALRRGDLFRAAEAFEEARKLMPAHPAPRLNLGLVLERAGRIDDAIAEYRKALDVAEGFMPAMQALVRCQLRYGRADDDTTALLAEIAVRGVDASWRAWARGQHLKRSDARADSPLRHAPNADSPDNGRPGPQEP
jgi:tetratricopeptide (TPR) repeat protein